MPDVVLKVATYNANSIRTRLEQVLEWLGQGKAEVLCIQETSAVPGGGLPRRLPRAKGPRRRRHRQPARAAGRELWL